MLSALERLRSVDELVDDAEIPIDAVDRIEAAERRTPLVQLRKEAVLAALAETGAFRVLDLGCGQGALRLELQAEARFTEIVGADVSSAALSSEGATYADRDHG